ncbi:HEAT repeat domain-containing protein, partial [Mesorhizobium sp. M4B.F.Ca.ET.049.02.1.2]|uniref:HEAT repeat domain-containing protein n=1 Tax=Mesorhizobium sp. M4B.F.Ca.ET.049.02.1.2 TaxID=2496752 RepID=UPI000FD61A6D
RDEYWQVRQKCLNALGKLKAQSAVWQISELLTSDMASVRKEAAAALGEIADPSSRDALTAQVGDADPDVRKTVRWALTRLG